MSTPTDANDLAALQGLDAVAELVARAKGVQPVPPPAEWPDPIMPGQSAVPEIPGDVLPSWMQDMASAVSAATQTPSALAVMLGLSVLASVLQRRFEVEPLDGYTEPLSLWTLTGLPSGTRKTAVLNAMTAPVVQFEKLERDRLRGPIARALSGRAVAKKRIERLLQDAAKAKDDKTRELIRVEIQREEQEMPEDLRPPRWFTGDCTAERLQSLLVEHAERMAVLSDEAGIFLIMAGVYSGGVASLDVFLQGHAGTAMRVDRAGRMAHLDRPALTFGLALQPGVLSDVAGSRRFRDSGLLARFLYAMPPSNVGRRDVRRHEPVPPGVRDEYQRQMYRLMEDSPTTARKPAVLSLSGPAREVWFELADEIEREQGEGGRYESISDWTSKLPGAAARIAGLLELAEAGLHVDSVSAAAMARAARLARLLIPHAQAAFGLLGTDGADTDAAAIVKWLQAGELAEFSRRECQKAMEGRFRNIERLAKALTRLDQQNVVQEFKRHNRGAPPTMAYRVNPKALST